MYTNAFVKASSFDAKETSCWPPLVEASSTARNYTEDNYTNQFQIYILEKFMYTIAFVEASSFDAKETFC